MIYQRFFVGLLVLLIQANLIALGQPNCGNYTSDSAYRANLNATLSSLSTNIGNDGFYNASTGKGPDRANAVVLCKGDLQLNECRECVKEAGAAVMESCPVAKQNIYLGELCTLRYSNESFRGTLATLPRYFVYSDENVTSPEQFKKDLRNLLDDLRGRAAGGSSTRKVAAGNATAPDFQTIFGLVQCTPDLSTEDCTSCLIGAILYIPLCCEESMPTGGAIYVPSCNIRYKTIPFFNTTRLQELEFVPPPPSPPPILEPPPPILEPPPQLSPPGKKNGSTTQTIVIVIVVVVACLIVALSAIIFLRMRKKHKPTKIHQSDISTVESVQYTFSTIKAATNDFSNHNKLGQGGFGAVYKGELPNGQEIAVKRLSRNSGQGDIEFKNEVLLLAKLQHRNLVRLMGFALEGMEKLLVYEFVQNASLDKFIFDSVRRSYLDWDARYKIIGGIARGILYLHEDSRLKIIHRDLKVSNILLDSEMRPKIADFGMARLFGQDETHANTRRIAGTYGYMPPEYLRHGQFSIKSDVYSFGVLVIEIISGHRNYGFQSEDGTLGDLMSFAWKCWQEGRGEEVVEPFLRNGSGSTNEMLRCIHIGLLCVQENAADRPTMASVMLMLSSFSMTLNIPLEPAFYSNGGGGGGGGGCEVLRIGSSRNQASITDLQPR